jgi:heptosyltransferase-2
MSCIPSPATSGETLNILVVRFGALGDLCLLGWALSRLAARPGGRDLRVTLVTKATFAPLMEHVDGIHRVVPLAGTDAGQVARLASHLRASPWDLVIDAHNTLRSHLLLGLMGRRPDRRLAKDTLARLVFLGWGHRQGRLDRTMHDRFTELTGCLAEERGPDPAAGIRPPLASLAPPRSFGNGPGILGLAPGAQWATKRWPEEHFSSLLRLRSQARPGRVRIFLGPREEAWFPGGPLEQAALDSGHTEIIRSRPLTEVAALLGECRLLATNDSGLLHVAEAVGTPVLAFFGPTVREFGYYPVLAGSRVLETTLDCRPCSRNGKRPCHRGDLACLDRILPAEAAAVLAEMEAEE